MSIEKQIAQMDPDLRLTKLMEEVDAKRVNAQLDGSNILFTYDRSVQYENTWNIFHRAARGLIIDLTTKKIIGLPFAKFFNYGENDTFFHYKMKYDILEKVDGSLGIAYYHKDRWKIVTKGSFHSDQGLWATKFMYQKGIDRLLKPGWTYLFEIVYPGNKIVVNYHGQEALYFLDAYYNESGARFCDIYTTFSREEFVGTADGLMFPKNHNNYPLDYALQIVDTFSKDREGFVISFADGHRVKVKGKEYLTAHRVITNLTPLRIWETVKNKCDPEPIRKQLQEEDLDYFDRIFHHFSYKEREYIDQLENLKVAYKDFQPKALGLMKQGGQFNPFDAKHVFALNVGKYSPQDVKELGRLRDSIFEEFRPRRNIINL